MIVNNSQDNNDPTNGKQTQTRQMKVGGEISYIDSRLKQRTSLNAIERAKKLKGQIDTAHNIFVTARVVRDIARELNTKEQLDPPATEGDVEEMIANPPKKPSFPYALFLFTIFVDSAGAFLAIITLFLVIPVFLYIFFWILCIISWIWVFMYLNGKVGFFKKWIIRKIWKKLILRFLLKFIPILGSVSFVSIYIIYAHNQEKKLMVVFFTVAKDVVLNRFGFKTATRVLNALKNGRKVRIRRSGGKEKVEEK